MNFNTDEAYGGSSGLQPGSTYKLFTLLDWLKTGHTLDTDGQLGPAHHPRVRLPACGRPTRRPVVGRQRRGDGRERPPSVTQATAQSINGAFATMGEQQDLCDIRKTAQSFDVHTAKGGQLEANPSSIIGTNYVAPLTMATAYAGIANNGKTCTPVAIDRVVKADGSVPRRAEDVVPPAGRPPGRDRRGVRAPRA